MTTTEPAELAELIGLQFIRRRRADRVAETAIFSSKTHNAYGFARGGRFAPPGGVPINVDPRINDVTSRVIAAAIKIRRALGPGLLESVYFACMVFELRRSGLSVQVQRKVRVHYDGVNLDCGHRIDIVAEDLVVVELKAVRKLAPIHVAQILTYLKLTGYPMGLLINFNVVLLKNGIRRVINTHPRRDP